MKRSDLIPQFHCPTCLVGSIEPTCWLCGTTMQEGHVARKMMRPAHDETMHTAATSYMPAEKIDLKELDGLLAFKYDQYGEGFLKA